MLAADLRCVISALSEVESRDAEIGRLREALLGYDADDFGAALYDAFWRRNDTPTSAGPWKAQAEAIRTMWRGIAVDAARYLARSALSALPVSERIDE